MIAVDGMSPRRLWSVQLVITGVILWSLGDIVCSKEQWPFSDYRLYANVERERSLTLMWLYGVTDEEPVREVSLLGPQHVFRYIYPFNYDRLMNAFRKMGWEGDPQPQLVKNGVP